MSTKTKILIHYTHKETLGHTTRVIAICRALAARYRGKIALHLLQGGTPQDYIKFPRAAQVIHIPYPFDTRASFNGISGPRHTAARARFILDQARRLSPDIFITEFFPFGRLNYTSELLPTLQYLSGTNTRIYASIGYPYLLNLISLREKKFNAMLDQLIGFYNKILIHTPPGLENAYFEKSIASPELKKQYRRFFAGIKQKTVYTGYILPRAVFKDPLAVPALLQRHPGYTVVVSRGGGAVYPKVILNAIQAQAILGCRYRFIIACGPATSAEEQKLFGLYHKKYNTGHVLLFNHIPHLEKLIKTCDVSVSLGGYNTCVQLMQTGTRAIIIPHQHKHAQEATTDQQARSQLMKRHFQSTVIPYADLTPAILAHAIKQKCQMPRPPQAPAAWFDGDTLTTDILMQTVPAHAPLC